MSAISQQENPLAALGDFYSDLFAAGESYASTLGIEAAALQLRYLGLGQTALNNWMQGYPPQVAIPAAILGTAAAYLVGIPLAVVLAETTLPVIAVVAVETFVAVQLSDGFNTVGLSIYDSIQQSLNILSQATGIITPSPTDPNTYVLPSTDASGATGSTSVTMDPNSGSVTITTISIDAVTGLQFQQQNIYAQFTGATVSISPGVVETVTGDNNTIGFIPGVPAHGYVYGNNNWIDGNTGSLIDATGNNDLITADGDNTIAVTGNSNQISLAGAQTVTVVGDENSIGATGAPGNTVTVAGNNNTIGVQNGVVNVQGIGDLLYGASDKINVGAGSSITITGNNSTINAANDDTILINASNAVVTAGDNLTLTASSANVTAGNGANITGANVVVAGSDATVHSSSSGASINVGDNSVVVANGTLTAGNYSVVTDGAGDVTVGNNSAVTINGYDASGVSHINAGSNSVITAYGSNGEADVLVGAASTISLQASNSTLRLADQNIDLTITGTNDVVDLPQTIEAFAVTEAGDQLSFSSPGQPIETINDDGTTTFNFLDETLSSSQLATYASDEADIAPGQNIGLTSTLSPMNVNLQTTTVATSVVGFVDKRPQETHTASDVYDQALSGRTQLGALTVNIPTDSGIAAGTLDLSYAANALLLHAMPKSATAQTFAQDYDVSITDQQGQSFTQTEVVDVTGYALTSVSGQTTGSVTENSSTTATGTLSLTDYDPLDVHTPHVSFVSIVGGGQTSQVGQLTVTMNSDTGANEPTGFAGWSYSLTPAAIAALPEDQAITETFQVTFSDGAGNVTAPENVTITINTLPNNGPPTVQFDMSHAGTVTTTTVLEYASGTGAQTTTGKFFFSDTNLRDYDTASYSLPAGSAAGALSLSQPVKDSDGYYEVDWTYTATDAQIANYDGANQELANYFDINISDGRGNTIQTPLTIWTERDGPYLVGSVSGISVVAGSSTTSEFSSSDYFFNDYRYPSTHALSAPVFVSSQAPGGEQVGSFAARMVYDTNVILAHWKGEVSYSFTVNNSDLAFLNDGQTVTEYWALNLTSNAGLPLTETVPVTITRTNEMAVSGATMPAVINADTSTTGVEITGAQFAFTDGAKADSHTVSAIFVPTAGSTNLGMLTPTIATDTTGSGTGGEVTWTYHVNDAVLNAARTSGAQTVTENWNVVLNDGHGGTETQNVAITIAIPADHAPVTTAFEMAPVAESQAPVEINLAEYASDSDAWDTLSVVAGSPTVVSSDGHAVAFTVQNGTLTIDPSQFAYLGGGQQVSLAIGYDVTDGIATTHGTGTLTIDGVNHNPVITSNAGAPETGAVVADSSFPASSETAIGNVTFTDADLSDSHVASVSLLSDPSSIISQGTLTATLVSDTTGSGTGGNVTWNYAVNDAALSSLQDGQTVTGSYLVAVDNDHGGTASQEIDINVTRPADQTIIAVGGAIGSLTNVANDSAVETATGILSFSDSNQLDGHTVGAPVFLSSDGGTTPIGSLQASLAADTTSSGTGGQVAWSYSANDAALYALAENQTVHETWQVAVSDGHGGTTTQNIVISLTGPADHAPVITSAAPSLAISELPSATGSAATDQQTATIVFTDVDPNDLPTASIGSVSAVYTDASGQVQSLTAGEISSLDGALAVSATPGNTDNGSASLTYAIANNALDFLGQGQTVVLTANVTVDDHHGGTASTPVTVTIDGVENAPIVSVIPTVNVAENSAPFTVNLLSTASDVDQNNLLSLVAGSLAVTASDGHAVSATLSGDLLTIDPSQFAYLGAGQQVSLAVAFEVTDGIATTPGAGTIAVTGVNQAPVVTSNAGAPETAAVTADASLPASSETTSGDITFADVNLSDVHTISTVLHAGANVMVAAGILSDVVTETTGGVGGQVAWTYNVSDAALAALQDGQTVTGDYTLTVNDGHGGTASQDIDVSITRAADRTVIVTGGAAGSLTNVANDSATETVAGILSFIDGDKLDSHAVAAPVFLSSDGGATPLGSLQDSLTTDTTSSGTGGQVAWTYSASDAALYALAANQTVHETWQVAVSDGHGGTTIQDVVISLTGPADHAPVITSNAAQDIGTTAELAAAFGSSAVDASSGTITFSDADLSDAHTVTLTPLVPTVSTGTLTSAEQTLFENALSLTEHDSTGTGTGSVNWAFSTADSNLDFLGAGQTVTEKYNLAINDGHGGTATQQITETITGANDAPTVTSATLTGSVNGSTHTASGAVDFNDPDLIDTHSIVSVSLLSTDETYDGGGQAYGALTATLVHDTTNGTGGVIDWSYALGSPPAGAAIHETWGVVFQDSAGAQVTEDVAITVGQNSSQLGIPVGFYVNNDGLVGASPNSSVAQINATYGSGMTGSNEAAYTYKIVGTDTDYTMSGNSVKSIGQTTSGMQDHTMTLQTVAANSIAAAGPTYQFTVTVHLDSNAADESHGYVSSAFTTAYGHVTIDPNSIHMV